MHLMRNYRESLASVGETAEEPNTAAKEMFRIQAWHRAYAQALSEVDPVKLVTMIEAAERAILIRSTAVTIPPMSTDEIIDLQRASEVLLQLKATNDAPYGAKFLVA